MSINCTRDDGRVVAPNSIEAINDEIEELAVHLSSFSGLLFFMAHPAEGDLNRSNAFQSLGNTAEAAYERLQAVVERLAPFERLTVKHTLDEAVQALGLPAID
jgi:hypothetical protein